MVWIDKSQKVDGGQFLQCAVIRYYELFFVTLIHTTVTDNFSGRGSYTK